MNTLDYTAAVFPVTKVDPAIDLVEEDYTPLNDLDKAIHEECKSASGSYSNFLIGHR